MTYIPEDLRRFIPYLNNTGGNDPEKLLERLDKEKNLMLTNSVVATLASMVHSQVFLLKRLKEEGFLASPETNRLILEALNYFAKENPNYKAQELNQLISKLAHQTDQSIPIGEGQHEFLIVWDEGRQSVKIRANHPDEVWGKFWPDSYPPDDAKIL